MSSCRLAELLGPKLLCGKDEVLTDTVLEGVDIVGLYFAAHWAPPCRLFTPELAKWYNDEKMGGKNIIIIFISCDRDPHAMKFYFSTMPWYAVPFNPDIIRCFIGHCSVQSIPKLVNVKRDGTIADLDARNTYIQGSLENNAQ